MEVRGLPDRRRNKNRNKNRNRNKNKNGGIINEDYRNKQTINS